MTLISRDLNTRRDKKNWTIKQVDEIGAAARTTAVITFDGHVKCQAPLKVNDADDADDVDD